MIKNKHTNKKRQNFLKEFHIVCRYCPLQEVDFNPPTHPQVWNILSEYRKEKKNRNFRMDRPGRQFLNQVIKLNTTSDGSC